MDCFNIENLSFTYTTQTAAALRDISLDIKQGEFVLLCGRSGCGKTTLLRSLKPELFPNGKMCGKVLFQGEELKRGEQRSEIGFVMQDPQAAIVTDKVWHELAFGLENLGTPQQEIRIRVAETAAFFGLADCFREDVETLSGGQKQLLCLAAVMVMQPKVLLLDEPTSRLDPIAASEFLSVVKKINLEMGTTIILSEQRLEEAMTLCDRAVVLDEGRVLSQGTVREVGKKLSDISHEMTAALPAAMRVYASVGKKECPVSVREGRRWLDDILPEIQVKKVMHEEKERNAQSIISMKDVCYSYGTHEVLRNLSLDVRFGEVCALLGANGVGKSTVISLVSGLLKPDSGRIIIDGKGAHTAVAAVVQEPRALFLKDTLTEDLFYTLKGCGLSQEEKEAEIKSVSQLCEIEGLLERHPYDISGGELQRAALAKVLLKKPSLLLLDEPTKGMDAFYKMRLGELLQTLSKNGTTILLVSHDTEFCAKFCDRCAMIFDGAVVEECAARDFFAGKSYYTTAANRMARGKIDNAVLTEDIIFALGGKEPEQKKHEYKAQRIYKTDIKPMEPPKKSFSAEMLLMLLIYLIAVPVTVLCGVYLLNDRKIYFISLLIIFETLVPFFVSYERHRPRARDVAVLATLCAVCVAGRVAFYMLPQIKPVLALVIICGAGMGAQDGFLIGAMTAFVSNMFFGQGAWTPWQMLALGIIGFLAGVLFYGRKIKKIKTALCIYAALSAFVIYGIIMNLSSALMWQSQPTAAMMLPVFAAGLPFDLLHCISSALFMWIIGVPMLKKIDRINRKNG